MPKTPHRKLLERHIQSGICKQHTLILGQFNFKSRFLALIEERRRFYLKTSAASYGGIHVAMELNGNSEGSK